METRKQLIIDITPAANRVELPPVVTKYISPHISSVLQYLIKTYISYRMFRNYDFKDGRVTTQSDYLLKFIDYHNLKDRVPKEYVKELFTYTGMIYSVLDQLFDGTYHQTEYLDDEATGKRPAVPYSIDQFYETSQKVVSKRINGQWVYLLIVE